MHLLETRKCKSGFLAVRAHYSIDPELWPAERIGSIRAAMPGWRWRKEYEIDFDARSGQKVYDNFDANVHVRNLQIDLNACPKYKVIDHGRRNPTVCLWWIEHRPSKTVYFYREYYRADATIADHCRTINQLEEPNETRFALIDPSTHRRLDNSYSTVADEYARHGVRTVPADNNLAAGIEAVTAGLIAALARWSIENNTPHPWFQERLVPQQRLYALAEDRALYFHPSMTHTIREIEQLSWLDSADHDNSKPLCERIGTADDHCCDCLRYALLRPRVRINRIQTNTLRRI
jgi:hypothetical protein